MQDLGRIVEQYRRDEYCSFRLFLAFQKSVVSSDRILFQASHGAASVKYHDDFC